jgi:hypothetical protein
MIRSTTIDLIDLSNGLQKGGPKIGPAFFFVHLRQQVALPGAIGMVFAATGLVFCR